MEHLGVEPIQLVPVKPCSGFIHPIKAELIGGFLQTEALFHALWHRPAQQGHVIRDRLGGISHRAELVDGGDAITF